MNLPPPHLHGRATCFSALALGVAGLGDVGRLGRIGAKTFAYTICHSAWWRSGWCQNSARARASRGTRAALAANAARGPAAVTPADSPVGLQAVLAIVPDNPLRAAVNGDMLAVMFFSLMIGLGLALAPRETVAPLIAVLEGLYAVVMKVIDLAMKLAPYGVAACSSR
jgi:DAACS family dicarboxylate/amino acid:cation (Na+ or H+) symporter